MTNMPYPATAEEKEAWAIENGKPPLGIKPRFIMAEERLFEIDEAIDSRVHTKHPIPIEWIEERNELVTYLKGREKND